ncbi:MAG TPA: HAD hydrolase-like protein [Terriglobales bacterium]|jgi:phosphoglycolate phosphatase-like HAD superfamily hydrolase
MAEQERQFDWTAADAYLFDIDGTLLNTQDLIHYNALNLAMRTVYGVDTTIDGIAFHGKTDLGILRAALERVNVSDAEFESKIPEALSSVREHVAEHSRQLVAKVCASVPDLLRHLSGQGKLLGVASGNLESVGWHKIEAAGLREFFSFGCFCDGHELRADIFKNAVDEVRNRLRKDAVICFIGDTPEDIRAARKVGAQIIAVCTGIYKGADLTELGPDACIASFAELFDRRGEAQR